MFSPKQKDVFLSYYPASKNQPSQLKKNIKNMCVSLKFIASSIINIAIVPNGVEFNHRILQAWRIKTAFSLHFWMRVTPINATTLSS